jgi:hypothetical protein
MIISPNPARRDSIRDTVSADNEQCIVATATAPTAQPTNLEHPQARRQPGHQPTTGDSSLTSDPVNVRGHPD